VATEEAVSTVAENEAVALAEAGPLLRFAAERVKDLDPDFSLAIAEAREAAQSDKWTPQVSQRFWGAFSKLCDIIQPVTMDCLAASHRDIDAGRWFRLVGQKQKISLAERSSRRYLMMLIILIAVILPLQLYVWTCTNLTKKVDELITSAQTMLPKLAAPYAKANTPNDPDLTASVSAVAQGANELNANVDQILSEAHTLDRVSMIFSSSATPAVAQPVSAPPANYFEAYENATLRLGQARTISLAIEEKANLFVGILLSFILPILIGTIGAIAYVIRAISDQIKTSTFSTSSPIQHLMRVALGALSGLVVGLFNGLSSQISLPPLAIAFLAGYGVEAVFSMFDGLIRKFRDVKP
jgi:hypothetical protein